MNLCDHDDEVSSSSDSILWTGLDEDDEDDVDDQDGQDDQVSRGLVVSTGLRTAAPPHPSPRCTILQPWTAKWHPKCAIWQPSDTRCLFFEAGGWPF